MEVKGREKMDSIEWISVQDRLPIVGEDVLVTIRDETGDTAYSYTTTGWYSGQGYKFVVDDEYNNYVTHWTSFPRPYRG